MTAGDPASLQINLLGHRVRITGPEEEIAPLRASLFTRCHEPADSPPAVAYEIEAAGEGYRVRRAGEGGEPEYEADDPSDLFWWLDNTLCSAALKSATDVLQIHGAAAVREGRAILLLGDSYAGKTSLTVHLLRRGFGFLTEEVIIIDPRTKRLLPFPRNLLVREGALQGDAELARICRGRWRYEDGEGEMKWFVDPARLGPAGQAVEARAGEMFWIERSEEGPARIEAIGMREAVEILVEQSMNLDKLGAAGVDAIVEIARQGRNFRLRAPHAGVAWELLRAHAGLPPEEGSGGAE